MSSKCFLILFIIACIISIRGYSREVAFIIKTDTSIIKIDQEKDNFNNLFDSLIKIIECDDTKIDIEIKNMQKKIDVKLNSMLKKLGEYKKDTMRVKPLIMALNEELKTYKNYISNQASILFWAYGVSSMQGERVISRNCFYLSALKKELFFLNAINEKIEGSFL
jgi:peptidoglycan hydrolase CwlO-like protein